MSVLSELRAAISDVDSRIADCKSRIDSHVSVEMPSLYKLPAEYIEFFDSHRSDFGWFVPHFTRLCMQIDSARGAAYRSSSDSLSRTHRMLADLVRQRDSLVSKYNGIVTEAREAAQADLIMPADADVSVY